MKSLFGVLFSSPSLLGDRTGRVKGNRHQYRSKATLMSWLAVSGILSLTPLRADIEELFPRLGDAVQERQTSSLEWPLSPFKNRARPPPPLPEDLSKVDVIVDPPTPAKQHGYKLVIDVGHGGRDFGAAGPAGISEKEVCLQIGRAVRRELERAKKFTDWGIETRLTREIDQFVPLHGRAEMANNWGADLFVSVHANSSSFTKARGYEVYFLNAEASDSEASRVVHLENGAAPKSRAKESKSEILSILSDVATTQHVVESSRLAENLYESLSKSFRSNGRGVRQAPFSVLQGTQMPSVLVEVGFVSNPLEARSLVQGHYVKRLAAAISSGIMDYLMKLKRFA